MFLSLKWSELACIIMYAPLVFNGTFNRFYMCFCCLNKFQLLMRMHIAHYQRCHVLIYAVCAYGTVLEGMFFKLKISFKTKPWNMQKGFLCPQISYQVLWFYNYMTQFQFKKRFEIGIALRRRVFMCWFLNSRSYKILKTPHHVHRILHK